jgi:hypothetical protein
LLQIIIIQWYSLETRDLVSYLYKPTGKNYCFIYFDLRFNGDGTRFLKLIFV